MTRLQPIRKLHPRRTACREPLDVRSPRRPTAPVSIVCNSVSVRPFLYLLKAGKGVPYLSACNAIYKITHQVY